MQPLPGSTSSLIRRVSKQHIRFLEWWSAGQLEKRNEASIASINPRKSPFSPRRMSTMPSPPPPPSPKGPDPGAFAPRADKTPPLARPSASIILVSPTNQVLLLHRVKTSTAFASAHVFPGGNLSTFHDGAVPAPDDAAARHADGLPYRLGAIRETFEESGILLARRAGCKNGKGDGVGEAVGEGGLLNLPVAERDRARKAIYENEISFGAWLESVGGVADTGMYARCNYD